jgi:hypothetical protein
MKSLLHLVGALAPALLAAGAGCEGSEDTGEPTPPASICAEAQGADTYAAGMEKQGAEGKLRVRLVESAPAPPGKGENVWTLQVMDAGGAAVDGAMFMITPFMPEHGHGSGVTPAVTELGMDGMYEVSGIDLAMAGVWEVTLVITTADGESDTVMFAFCVEG